MSERYTDLNSYLRARFGCRVQKITVDAGLDCPNRDGTISTGGCIYCNARGSGTGAYAQGLSIKDQLTRGKTYMSRRYKARKFMAYFQSFTNTYAPLDTLRKIYSEALAVEDIIGLSIGTRPDCIDSPVLDLLEDCARNHMIWIEYGLQSAHDRTLALINRGHRYSDFEKAVYATAGRGLKICVHVILGLPGENAHDMNHTARILARLPIDGIKLHLLYVVKGTKLENMYHQGLYRCLDQTEYVEQVCDFLERLPSRLIIQRLTGDPHRNELVAPLWSLEKSQTLQMIKKTLEERDTWQGKLAEEPNRNEN